MAMNCTMCFGAQSTLFIIASKTFTTAETMMNALGAGLVYCPGWSGCGGALRGLVHQPRSHARTGHHHHLWFWDWVGGRYSLWSAIGLPMAIAIGEQGFREFWPVAMPWTSTFAPLARNLPVRLGLLDVWYRNFYGFTSSPWRRTTHPWAATRPTCSSWRWRATASAWRWTAARCLRHVACHLGRARHQRPACVLSDAAPGPDVLPLEIVAVRKASHPLPGHQQKVLANALAQTQALMVGKASDVATATSPATAPAR
jgi:glucose-6-phosphate isomerase